MTRSILLFVLPRLLPCPERFRRIQLWLVTLNPIANPSLYLKMSPVPLPFYKGCCYHTWRKFPSQAFFLLRWPSHQLACSNKFRKYRLQIWTFYRYQTKGKRWSVFRTNRILQTKSHRSLVWERREGVWKFNQIYIQIIKPKQYPIWKKNTLLKTYSK